MARKVRNYPVPREKLQESRMPEQAVKANIQEFSVMTVFRSNKQIYVQLVDDLAGRTLVSASSRGLEQKATKTEIAALVGAAVAAKALEAGITEVVFDRNGYLFHGRVKSLADAARGAGLKF